MSEKTPLKNKIDFAIVISVKHANPNGDPQTGNRPRQTYDGYGEISDVCLKRKLRNRLLDMGEEIFVQSNDYKNDDCKSLKDRFDKACLSEDEKTGEEKNQAEIENKEQPPKSKSSSKNEKIDSEVIKKKSCEKWYDVRAFGQVFPWKGSDNGKKKKSPQKKSSKQDDFVDNTTEANDKDENPNSDSVSIGIRGPVSIQSAFSLEPVATESLQITKSVNLEGNSNEQKGADTIGMKHRVAKGIYVSYGSISPQLASLTNFTDEDAEKLKNALRIIFENDSSSARPVGSMEVLKVVWWKHDSPCGKYSSAVVHRALEKNINKDGSINYEKVKEETEELEPEFLDPLQGEELKKIMKPKQQDDNQKSNQENE